MSTKIMDSIKGESRATLSSVHAVEELGRETTGAWETRKAASGMAASFVAGLRLPRAGDRTRTGDVQLGKLAFYH
jgi:hypothetical protein